jgi:hypothetical protein
MKSKEKKESRIAEDSRSAMIFTKSWKLLKEVQNNEVQKTGEVRSLKEILHDAVEAYSKCQK